jgi:hypothetical protein
MEYSLKKIGEIYFRTPRNTIKSFVNFLAILDQYKEAKWQEELGHVEIDKESNPDLEPLPVDAETIQVNNEPKQTESENLGNFKL